ncbi:DNA translocase FtsK [Candidatus Liberibacter sp.]|uniref:DNA translocase FtsK n=1 Tax=Candidatus Liberibacter sp. TaxID=34022 RepID=UPI0015F3D28F|nr:DNA translocase FtsK [Candidatus Liberibacter sp.]MBA5723674.1 DNA translocase FtsK [Candidatus Liberibacter sp.]
MKLSKIDSYWNNPTHKKVDLRLSSLPSWHKAFLLAPNVRFTRTPENGLNRHHNNSLLQNPKAIKNDILGGYPNVQWTEENLKSTSSLVNLKTQLMMNSTEGNQSSSKTESHKLHATKEDTASVKRILEKVTIQFSSENTKSASESSPPRREFLSIPEKLSWLSDFAFFEGYTTQNPLISFIEQKSRVYTTPPTLPENHSGNPECVTEKFQTAKAHKEEEPVSLRIPTISIVKNDQKVILKNCACKKPISFEKKSEHMIHQTAQETQEREENYEKPRLSFLREKQNTHLKTITPEYLERSAEILENVLEDFGIKGEIIDVNPGPVVTLYVFEPAPGIKSSRIIGLADDIARSMSSLSARVAIIPKRNAIGIELPNDIRETVYLRQIIESQRFSNSKAELALCLGKTISGEPLIADLAKMPHILVAGTTGSGKSVTINTMIMSLLYRLRPDECRMIMVDPKMLELSIYDGIPHLLTPVVTDPKKAIMSLKWAVREMEERYRKMSQLSVRNIKGYNERITAMNAEKNSSSHKSEKSPEHRKDIITPMPYIVIVVDEMADLMMIAGKEIEGEIQRLAQMARAAGIHLIMATQRPSVDVITGTIKANLPTRISFQVTSKIDSRTILGEHGAEQLLGQGDMLYMSGGGRIQRVHGPFISDLEIEEVVQHLKEQGNPEYLKTVIADNSEKDNSNPNGSSEEAKPPCKLYEKAVELVISNKKCSTSFIQRRLQIGYNRAALLVERMEQEKIISTANHVGKRHILSDHLNQCH